MQSQKRIHRKQLYSRYLERNNAVVRAGDGAEPRLYGKVALDFQPFSGEFAAQFFRLLFELLLHRALRLLHFALSILELAL